MWVTVQPAENCKGLFFANTTELPLAIQEPNNFLDFGRRDTSSKTGTICSVAHLTCCTKDPLSPSTRLWSPLSPEGTDRKTQILTVWVLIVAINSNTQQTGAQASVSRQDTAKIPRTGGLWHQSSNWDLLFDKQHTMLWNNLERENT